MSKQERIMGLFLIALNIAVVFYAVSELSLGTIEEPGPGFFPALCGTLIIILCAHWLISHRHSVFNSKPLWEQGKWVAPLIAVIIIIIYTSLLETLGYATSTFVFLIAWQLGVERERWLKTGLIAVIGTVAMYTVFSYLLGVPLPEGMFI